MRSDDGIAAAGERVEGDALRSLACAELPQHNARPSGSFPQEVLAIRLPSLVVGVLVGLPVAAQEGPPPIIDVHLHAQRASESPQALCLPVTVHGIVDPQCRDPLWSAATDDALVDQTVAALRELNVSGVVFGSDLGRVAEFVNAADGRLIPGYVLDLGDDEVLSPSQLREHLTDSTVQVIGEIENQYSGIEPGDPRMDPYWALAVEFDVPVILHMGEGYPGAPYTDSPDFRVGAGSPLLLEDVLVRYPELRLSVTHYGSPLVDEMIGVLYHYPNVYVDVASNVWHYPREYFWSQLRRLVDAGFTNRIMFGSDQLRWPQLIDLSIDVIQEAPFLTPEQKRDILYNNAARFLRRDR